MRSNLRPGSDSWDSPGFKASKCEGLSGLFDVAESNPVAGDMPGKRRMSGVFLRRYLLGGT